jgi:Uri superfamily endonuclease
MKDRYIKADCLPSRPGSYLLHLYLKNHKTVQIGRLGKFDFPAGYYIYAGSAFGSGGLAARLKHHLNSCAAPHWHIDYLRKEAAVREIWFAEQKDRREHHWASVLHGLKGSAVPALGFGASDCNCYAHLFHFRKRPLLSAFQAAVWEIFPDDIGISKLQIRIANR